MAQPRVKSNPQPVLAGDFGGSKSAILRQTRQMVEDARQMDRDLNAAEQTITAFTGMMAFFAKDTDRTGWLRCAGQPVSRATYAALFAYLGTTYGAGDGSTTFNVPDARGRVIACVDNLGSSSGGGTAAGRLTSIDTVPGAAGGTEKHVLDLTELPAHGHGYLRPNAPGASYIGIGGQAIPGRTAATTDDAGGGLGHNNVQPTLVGFCFIKT